MALQPSQATQTEPAWWWRSDSGLHNSIRSVTCSEMELLSAAVLCAALSATKAAPSASDALANMRAARELEMHVRKSLLPHTLRLPVLEFTPDYVVVESEGAVVCAVRATSPGDIVQVVASSVMPMTQPCVHRFGGAVIHAPFWKRAQRLDFAKLRGQAQKAGKMLLLCGHSIGASIAKLAFCELVYGGLPHSAREVLETMDADQANADGKEKQKNEPAEWMEQLGDNDRESALQNVPVAMAVAFGAPFAGNDALNAFLLPLGLNDRVVTFVNEFDCIPGILNVAHSAAMLAKTAEGLVTIAEATKSLLNLLPTPMQQRIADMVDGARWAAVPSTTSARISMRITMLQQMFDKLRAKSMAYRYAPLGTYVFMAKENADFNVSSDPIDIRKRLGEDGEKPAPGLTGNSILQHVMSAYVESIARRTKFSQINATMNHYQRLGVARNATDREICISYRSLSLKWHPDRIARESLTDQEKERAEDIFKLMSESYAVLKNKESRLAYDAYLNRPPSRREEFVRYGTVAGGMTLLEAISLFEKAVNNVPSTMHPVTDRFISSSSATLQNAGKAPAAATASCEHATSSSGVHSLSAQLPVTSASASTGVATVPDPASASAAHQISSGAPLGSSGVPSSSNVVPASATGTGTSDVSAALGKTGELVANNNAEISTQSIDARNSDSIRIGWKSSSSTLRRISILGGAVVVAASVAILVSAWSQFSEASRKKRQAAVVREMSGDCLVLLLEDRRSVQNGQSRTLSIEMLQQSKARQTKASTSAKSGDEDCDTSGEHLGKQDRQVLAQLTKEAREQGQDEKLIEAFFDCVTDDENAAMDALVEDEFFDCVELAKDFDRLFAQRHERRMPELCVMFLKGSKVNTPFGLGVVEDWRESTAAASIRLQDESLRDVDKEAISRGTSTARELTKAVLEERRADLAERVITKYNLEERHIGDQITSVALAGASGAVDSGLRAAGGLALANGVARSGTALGGMVAAPLAVASILVDIGKEFYDYRKKHSERRDLGVLSSTSERLLRREFRLKTGEAVVSRTTAAAGAGLSAYGVASAMALWASASVATGPIGIAAATCAAIAGSVAGYFGGAKIYSLSTASYFKNQKDAKEHIDRLELGARVLFEEHDPTGTGEISKASCQSIMQKLYEISGDTSDLTYEASVEAIKDGGSVTWCMFWIWVSTEAARALESLERQASKPAQNGADVLQKPGKAKPNLHEKHNTLTKEGSNTGLTGEDFKELDPEDPVEQVSARKIIALQSDFAEPECESADTFEEPFPVAKKDDNIDRESVQASQIVASQSPTLAKLPPPALSSGGPKRNGPKPPLVDPQLDVMCSLMSTDGIKRFLKTQYIVLEDSMAHHEDLHCLALALATPPDS